MTEATKRYIPEINAVDGFSPAEFTRELPSDDGTTSLYMDVKFRLLWFRLHRPNGKVEPELVSVDDKSAVVCCKIFNDRSDASDQFVAKSYAQRFRSDEKFGDRFLEVAETAAVGRALASAGYQLITALRVWSSNRRNQNAILLDTVCGFHHGFVILDFEWVVLKGMQFRQRNLLNLFQLCILTAFFGGEQIIYRCQLYFFRAAFQVSTPPSSDFDTPLPPCRQGHGRKYFFPLR